MTAYVEVRYSAAYGGTTFCIECGKDISVRRTTVEAHISDAVRHVYADHGGEETAAVDIGRVSYEGGVFRFTVRAVASRMAATSPVVGRSLANILILAFALAAVIRVEAASVPLSINTRTARSATRIAAGFATWPNETAPVVASLNGWGDGGERRGEDGTARDGALVLQRPARAFVPASGAVPSDLTARVFDTTQPVRVGHAADRSGSPSVGDGRAFTGAERSVIRAATEPAATFIARREESHASASVPSRNESVPETSDHTAALRILRQGIRERIDVQVSGVQPQGDADGRDCDRSPRRDANAKPKAPSSHRDTEGIGSSLPALPRSTERSRSLSQRRDVALQHGHIAPALPRESSVSLALRIDTVAAIAHVALAKIADAARPWALERVQDGYARVVWTRDVASSGFFFVPLAPMSRLSCVTAASSRVIVTLSRSADARDPKIVIFDGRPAGPPCVSIVHAPTITTSRRTPTDQSPCCSLSPTSGIWLTTLPGRCGREGCALRASASLPGPVIGRSHPTHPQPSARMTCAVQQEDSCVGF